MAQKMVKAAFCHSTRLQDALQTAIPLLNKRFSLQQLTGQEVRSYCAAGELQISLQREQVLWKHGLLVIPAIVYDLLNTMMVCIQPGIILGCLSWNQHC